MNKWTINYYNKHLYKDIFSMPKEILASYIAISDRMEISGPNIGMPHTRALGNSLFEIRASGKEGIGRVFYCSAKKNEIWMLHSIIKKTQQTPAQALKLARNRLKEITRYD